MPGMLSATLDAKKARCPLELLWALHPGFSSGVPWTTVCGGEEGERQRGTRNRMKRHFPVSQEDQQSRPWTSGSPSSEPRPRLSDPCSYMLKLVEKPCTRRTLGIASSNCLRSWSLEPLCFPKHITPVVNFTQTSNAATTYEPYFIQSSSFTGISEPDNFVKQKAK